MNYAIAAFDCAVVEGVEIDASALVPGSATLSIGGGSKSSVSLDGCIVSVRDTIARGASFKALGDFSNLSSPSGWPVAVALRLAGVELASFNALVSVAYDSNTRSSSFILKGEPQDA